MLTPNQIPAGFTLISNRHFDALADGFSEIMATNRGESDQDIGVIIDHVLSEIIASNTSPIQGMGLEVEPASRTMSGEMLFNMLVTAYMQDTEYGGKFATHWSTIPQYHNPIRLFSEDAVHGRTRALWLELGSILALLDEADVSPKARQLIRDALERVTGTKAPQYLGGSPTVVVSTTDPGSAPAFDGGPRWQEVI